MITLHERSRRPELMDDPGADPADVEVALSELDRINAWLGGWSGSRRLVAALKRRRSLSVLDVGGGGGGTAADLVDWGRQVGVDVRVTLVDVHPAVVSVARVRCPRGSGVHVVRCDAFHLPFPDGSFDVSHAGLFLHHFSEDDAVAILREMRRVARVRVVVNDLYRSRVALVAIRALTRLLSRSHLVRHDAPLSVRRGFREPDLERLREGGPFPTLAWRRRWPYRVLAWMDAGGGP